MPLSFSPFFGARQAEAASSAAEFGASLNADDESDGREGSLEDSEMPG